MLNIIKLKHKIPKSYIIKSEGKWIAKDKFSSPAVKEWKDSVFAYNKNTEKLLPVTNNYIFNLLKSYFNMYNKHIEKFLKSPRMRLWKRRQSTRKIWISKPELKHSNDNITINIYVYNRISTLFYNRFNKLIKLIILREIKFKRAKPKAPKSLIKYLKYFKLKRYHYNFLKFYKLNFIKNNSNPYYVLIKKSYRHIYKLSGLENIISENAEKYKNNVSYIKMIRFKYKLERRKIRILYKLKKHFRKTFALEIEYEAINKLMLNTHKLYNKYLKKITVFMEKVYRKDIKFNIIGLKTYNLDSNIFSQIVTSKIKKKRNKPLRVITTSVRKTKIHSLKKNMLRRLYVELINKQNYIISNNVKNINTSKNYITNALFKKFYKKKIKHSVLYSIKNKAIVGVRVEVSGRITRRLIAQRARQKIRYKGTLRNIDSSYRGYPSVMLKGYEKRTLQYAQFSSKRRIGAYGLKLWINTD